jgi:transposase
MRKEGIGLYCIELEHKTLTFYSAMTTIKQLWRFKRVKFLGDCVDEKSKRIVIKVTYDIRYKPICAHCRGKISIHQHETRVIRDMPLWEYSVFIEAHYRKGFCPHCGKIVVEHLEYTSPGLRMTNRLAIYIVELGRKMSDADIARLLNMRWHAVHKVHYEALEHKYRDMDYGTPRLLGVDEIATRKGHNYATVIVDLENGRVLSLEEGRTKNSLRQFYEKLTPKQREGIEAVVTDAWEGFISATKAMLPNAAIVTDYFHLVRKFNSEVIDTIRIQTYKSLCFIDKDRKIIKRSKYILFKRRDRLTQRQEAKLSEILETNQALFTAYTLKDMLHAMFLAKTEEEARERINMFILLAAESHLQPVKPFIKRVIVQAQYIINHAKYQITTGMVEGINHKIKNIKRRAYGIKDLQFLKLLAIDAFY